MTPRSARERNWFDAGGSAYARFRPAYPADLVAYLSGLAATHDLAVDVGCGNGQLTAQLADTFTNVLGVDPSQEQLASAMPHPRVRYVRADAEALPVADGAAALVTSAQAAHWFDLPAFFDQVRRIGAPGAVLALITYGKQRLDADLDGRFQRFYREEIGPFWPPERRLVDEGYRTLAFPFAEIDTPSFEMRAHFDLTTLLGYLSTWSASRHARDAGRADILDRFAIDITELWGDPSRERLVRWPISLRVAPVH